MITPPILLNWSVALWTLLGCARNCLRRGLVLIPGFASTGAVIELLARLTVVPFLIVPHTDHITTRMAPADRACDTGFVDLAGFAVRP